MANCTERDLQQVQAQMCDLKLRSHLWGLLWQTRALRVGISEARVAEHVARFDVTVVHYANVTLDALALLRITKQLSHYVVLRDVVVRSVGSYPTVLMLRAQLRAALSRMPRIGTLSDGGSLRDKIVCALNKNK